MSWIEFNIHDRVAVGVHPDAPTAPQLADMLAPFGTSGLDRYDLTITAEPEVFNGVAHGDLDYLYTDESLYVNDTKVQVVRAEDGSFRLHGSRELLVSALPLIDRIAVEKGAAMIHAATVAYRGRGICMPAWGGVGKTSTMAKLLRRDDAAFMGDDWAFLTADGQLLGYEKPMFIKPHHRSIYPHLFDEKRKPMVPSRLSDPLSRLTTIVHPVVTQYPRLAGMARHWSPEHMMVRPRDAFPDGSFVGRAPLAAVVFVERVSASRTVLSERSRDWMASRLVGNFHAELSRHSRELITALGATGLVPIDRAFADKRAVVESGLGEAPTYLLQVPKTLPPDDASDVIVDRLIEIAESGSPYGGAGSPSTNGRPPKITSAAT
ncbi:MAG: hypothetical protein U0T02_00830 [Solirubrobacteraceae bacterium]